MNGIEIGLLIVGVLIILLIVRFIVLLLLRRASQYKAKKTSIKERPQSSNIAERRYHGKEYRCLL